MMTLITNVREANQWLKRAGVSEMYKFSTRSDKTSRRVYILSKKNNVNKFVTLLTSPELGELVEQLHYNGRIPLC